MAKDITNKQLFEFITKMCGQNADKLDRIEKSI